MDTTSNRSIHDGVLCWVKPTLKSPVSEVKRNSRKLTPCRDSAGPPLSSGCGPWPHSLEKCWGLKRRTYSLDTFFYKQCQFMVSDRPRYVCKADGFLWSMWEDRLAVSVARKSGVVHSPCIDSGPRQSPYKQVHLVCNLFSSTSGVLSNITFKYPILLIPSVGDLL